MTTTPIADTSPVLRVAVAPSHPGARLDRWRTPTNRAALPRRSAHTAGGGPLRWLLAVVYVVVWLIAIVDGSWDARARQPASDGVRSFKAWMPPRALTGPLGARFVDAGGIWLRLIRPWARYRGWLEVSDELVRFEPNADQREIVRGGGCRRADVTSCTAGRFSLRRWWVYVETDDGGVGFLLPGRADAEAFVKAMAVDQGLHASDETPAEV